MDNFDLKKYLKEGKLFKEDIGVNKNQTLKTITKKLDNLGVKYTLSKSKVRLFDEIIKPMDKDDSFYNEFNKIIDLYNLQGVVKTK